MIERVEGPRPIDLELQLLARVRVGNAIVTLLCDLVQSRVTSIPLPVR
jgi:hypothetical protein